MTFCIPVGYGSKWAGMPHPGHITGELVFKLFETEDDTWLEAKFYFDPATWDIDRYGLIYTDRTFMSELQNRLTANKGFKHAQGIDYSECGMQGDNFIHMDVSNKLFTDLVRCGVKAHSRWPEFTTTKEHENTIS